MIFSVPGVQNISTMDTRHPICLQLPCASGGFRERKEIASDHFKKTEDWKVSHYIPVWTLSFLNFWIKDAFLYHENLSNALRMSIERDLDVKQTLSCLVSPGPRHFGTGLGMHISIQRPFILANWILPRPPKSPGLREEFPKVNVFPFLPNNNRC